MEIKNFILDIDGVFTTGQFLYTANGKFAKVFGAHDNDGIKLIRKYLNIHTITADKRGFEITKKRIHNDMKLKFDIIPEKERLSWLKENFDLSKSVYMGDGIYDAEIFKHVAYSIAPNSAFYKAKEEANFVTRSNAGEGAVAEACLHIIDKFFELPDKIKKN
ncbi:MAG: HAD hydrolase family protein [Candidatus Pacebacteria bacterium]|nr:HAD hydrolase family protein [Candidatus Paceibacterota bacterium]